VAEWQQARTGSRSQMRLAWTGTIAVLLLLIAPSAAEAAPACGEPPEIVGDTMIGSPCADFIPPPPRSITRVFGEGGDDVIFGGRGNDRLNGGEGNDRLYGGIGDDQLRGGNGDDRLSGGFGADSALDGEAGNDLVRGDATIDDIQNTGGGTDTLSYATGVTPGFFDRPDPPDSFPDFDAYAGFPQTPAGRGAYVNLGTGRGDNGRAPDAGGYDERIDTADFEIVIGTAFADYLAGTGAAQTFYGGGGADVIIGGGGNDTAYGGAEGDSCVATTTIGCESSNPQVAPRSAGTVAVGRMVPSNLAKAALYLTGSSGEDEVTATYAGGAVTFTLGPNSDVDFDAGLAAAGDCNAPTGGSVSCAVSEAPDSILLAGLGDDDRLAVAGFPVTTSVILLGNDGNDDLSGDLTEDAVVDGPGNDTVRAWAGDDAVPNNDGTDQLEAGVGEDLFISDAVCNSDVLNGGPDRDNANWAQFKSAVTINMATGFAGLVGPQGQAECPNPSLLTGLVDLEDIEGTSLADALIGDGGPNQLLGRLGADTYFANGGDDVILANSASPENPGDSDPLIDCGDGWDTALIDIPTAWTLDGPLFGCEDVEERAPNSFRPPGTPPDPTPPPPVPASASAAPKKPRPDVKAPQTRIVARPAALAWTQRRTRQVGFRFVANEARVLFRCRVDRGRFRPCRSPRRYRVRTGPHTFRVYAIDAAGNRDRSPAQFEFRVRRR
jgi:Ca2+-binding RTX toxin-like protein